MSVTIKPKSTQQPLPRLMRAKELAEQFGVKINTLYVWAKRGHFPKPIRITPRSLAWRFDDVAKWLEDRKDTDPNTN